MVIIDIIMSTRNPLSAGWIIPDTFPDITTGQLHVWKTRAGVHADDAILSADERLRLKRFRFAEQRQSFLSSHTLLRRLIGQYLNLHPAKIEFSYTAFNKPFLSPSQNDKQLEFNLSHSGEMILIGVTVGTAVGVDVEHTKPLPDLEQIAALNFSSGEQQDLLSLPEPQRVEAFYKCWTRKEALIKACGDGLTMSLDSFRVSLLPGGPARLIHSMDQRTWTLIDIAMESGYAAAAALPIANVDAQYYDAVGV